jgi:hypothetical protein
MRCAIASFCHADTLLSLRKPEFWAAARFVLQINSTFVGIVAGADNVLLAWGNDEGDRI